MTTMAMKRSISVEEYDDSVPEKKPNTEELSQSLSCPYLDTIDRNVLDFDFEKLCSVSLSRVNVYACLVCGKYFQVNGGLDTPIGLGKGFLRSLETH